jgi:vancomycin resistance protein VanW
MARKRLTQIFPWLLPLRKKQRLIWFYAEMDKDGNRYSSTQGQELLPYKLFEAKSLLYNYETGFDMVYQENKVFNLKLAAATLDKVLIRPGETFSFWRFVRHADKTEPYREGLIVKDGQLVTVAGGGMCQMSNLLFWVFLHSPLSVVERHTHALKDFPPPPSEEPEGVDATVTEGWLDLKVRNDTDLTFQIHLDFDQQYIIGSLLTDENLPYVYEIVGRDLRYFRREGNIFEENSIYRQQLATADRKMLSEELLYKNLCQIGYELPEGTPIS